MGQFLLIVAILVVVALLAWWHAERERKRREALATWCAVDGWSFDPAKVHSPGYGYELFERGHSRYQRFTARKKLAGATPGLEDAPGPEKATARLFEYHYAVTHSTGKSTHTDHYHFTCALLDPGADLGRVSLRREGLADKLAQAIGFDDIDLEDPEFSKRFVLRARERKDAYDLFDAAMMRYLCAHPDYVLEARGRELLAYVEEDASPETYRDLARFVHGFLAQLPRTLVNAERARQGLEPVLEAGNASTSSRRALDRLVDPRHT